MLCVNQSGVEAELKIRRLFDRFKKIVGLKTRLPQQRKNRSVLASINSNKIFKPEPKQKNKLFKMPTQDTETATLP